ncbi:MAG: DUF1127 domain-containing protein [Pseudomonadota bacterium]
MHFETNLTRRALFEAQPQPNQGRLTRLAKVILLWPSRIMRHRNAIQQFQGFLDMPDHLLNDIGLTRDQVIRDRFRYRMVGELPDYLR